MIDVFILWQTFGQGLAKRLTAACHKLETETSKGSQRLPGVERPCVSIRFLLCLFRFRGSLPRSGPHGAAAADVDVGLVSRFRATDMRLAAQHLCVTTDEFSHWAPPDCFHES